MSNDDILVGLDIGTSKICAVIAEIPETGGIDILGVGVAPSNGLRKGVVINIEATLRSVSAAIERAENMAGREVSHVITGISGAHIEGLNSRGVVAVTSKDREIGMIDVERVMDAAKAVVLPMDRELIHVIPQEFIVDDQRGVKDPIDMIGVRLEAEAHLITGSVTAAQNLLKCVNRAGFKVDEIALDVLVASQAVLSRDEMELGTMLIDIGGGTTDVILYKNGAPLYTNVVPVGGAEVTSDLSIMLQTPMDTMEEIKLTSGCCYAPMLEGDDSEIIIPGVGGRPPIAADRLTLCEYIQPRMTEIFSMVRDKVEHEAHFTRWQNLGGGIVLTGGGALLQGAAELAGDIFSVPVRIGLPHGIGGLTPEFQRPDLASAVGLILHRAKKMISEGVDESRGFETSRKKGTRFESLKKWFKNFIE
ncbi:cell division protein FtsA [Spirochaeta lutea]|uniref:Cell division protein FtsA n=1 Tax=Spirochaeta lutea TaxID=1480694 RepID=A0A098R436_9SPIO|nr:cell division protein FtsA [Spirochaeta lutea]KGE73512.1 cell division protein FtsA [Spirochaeta lutea]